MTINKIIEYCTNTPENTNASILRQMLNELLQFGEVYANVDNVSYKTLNEAIENAAAGAVIDVADNIVGRESISINKDLTLNLNGKTFANIQGPSLIITNNATVTITNGDIVGRIMVGQANSDGNLVIKDCVVDSAEKAEAAIQTNGLCKNSSATIKNCTLNSTDDTLYLPGGGSYVIENCVINGYTGIYAKSGDILIRNTKINAIGPYAEPVPNGNGASSTGDAIILDSKKGYSGNMKLTLEGKNEFNSKNGYAVHEALTDVGLSAAVSLKIFDGGYIGRKGAICASKAFDDAVGANGAVCEISGGMYNSFVK